MDKAWTGHEQGMDKAWTRHGYGVDKVIDKVVEKGMGFAHAERTVLEAPMKKKHLVERCGIMIVMVLYLIVAMTGMTNAQITSAPDTSTQTYLSMAKRFPDVPDKAWYAADLNFITSDSRKILEGSTDGKFYPDNKLSVEQFIKCVVVAAGFRPVASGGHWAQPYIDKALQLGIITQGQFASFRTGITRGEMATVIRSALVAITGEMEPGVNLADISARMSDYSQIPEKQRDAVCVAYHLGILTGMPDGKFYADRILTRAQAVAVIRRVIDASARIKLLPIGTTEGTDMWTDADFRAFMSTDEWKRYLNPNTIAGMQNGVLMFQKLVYPPDYEISGNIEDITRIPYKLPEPKYSTYYELAKTLGYYAKKYNGTATVGYSDEVGGVAEFDFSDQGGWIGRTPNPFFSVRITDIESSFPHIYQEFPNAFKDELSIEWIMYNFSSVSEHNSFYSLPINKGVALLPNKNRAILYSVADIVYANWNIAQFVKLIEDKYTHVLTGITQYSINGEHFGEEIVVYSYYPSIFSGFRYYTNGVD